MRGVLEMEAAAAGLPPLSRSRAGAAAAAPPCAVGDWWWWWWCSGAWPSPPRVSSTITCQYQRAMTVREMGITSAVPFALCGCDEILVSVGARRSEQQVSKAKACTCHVNALRLTVVGQAAQEVAQQVPSKREAEEGVRAHVEGGAEGHRPDALVPQEPRGGDLGVVWLVVVGLGGGF